MTGKGMKGGRKGLCVHAGGSSAEVASCIMGKPLQLPYLLVLQGKQAWEVVLHMV